jgi:hypothetical protein
MAKKPDAIEMPHNDDAVSPAVWDTSGRFDSQKAQLIYEESKNWPPQQQAAMLAALRSAEVRARVRSVYKHPAEIAMACDHTFVLTPAIDLTSKAIERVLRSPRPINLAISEPPQEGKSTLAAVWSSIRALQLDPDFHIILATYGDVLAQKHSRDIRHILQTHGSNVTDSLTGMPVEDKIGLQLKAGSNRIDAWSVEGGKGGLIAAGLGASITGHPADLVIIDDPFKGMAEADSKIYRQRVDEWFSSIAMTRLSPAASIILIQTRWHPEDLMGKVLTAERSLPKHERTWKHINIPAISEEGIKDSLGRPPGVPMISARDTPEAKRDFVKKRRDVGERTWYALYQGSPRNPAGGLFSRADFEAHRLTDVPLYPQAALVGVDPADSGEGDEAGIIGGMLMDDGKVALTHDRSGKYTADQWAHEAVVLALEMNARELAIEAYTASTTYVQVARKAYTAIHNEAMKKRAIGAQLSLIEQRALTDIPPFLITKWRGASKADAVARSALMRQAVETGTCVTVEGRLVVFEDQAADWQEGQHQPDRVAAAVIVHDKLADFGGMQFASPVGLTPPPPPAWMRRKL